MCSVCVKIAKNRVVCIGKAVVSTSTDKSTVAGNHGFVVNKKVVLHTGPHNLSTTLPTAETILFKVLFGTLYTLSTQPIISPVYEKEWRI